MTHSPSDVVRQLLIDLSLGTATGAWPVYVGDEPAAPDNCITIYDTQGIDHGRSMIDGELFGHYGFQVRIRSAIHSVGWTKADAVQTALAESIQQRGVRVDSSAYRVTCIAKIGDVLTLGKETPTSRRRLFTLNASISVEPVSHL